MIRSGGPVQDLLELPGGPVRPLHGRWHPGRISLGGAAIHPVDDRADLLLLQGDVVLESLDTHPLVHVPGRHHARLDPGPDHGRPGTDLLVGRQGHGSHSALLMALLTGLLQDGRDVLGEGRARILGRPPRRDLREAPARRGPSAHPIRVRALFVRPLSVSTFIRFLHLSGVPAILPPHRCPPSQSIGRLRRHRHPGVCVRPATVLHQRTQVFERGGAKHVVSGFAEGNHRRDLPARLHLDRLPGKAHLGRPLMVGTRSGSCPAGRAGPP